MKLAFLPILVLLSLIQFRVTLVIKVTNTISNSRPRLGETITLNCNIVGGTNRSVYWWKTTQFKLYEHLSIDCNPTDEYKPRLTNIKCEKYNYNFQLSKVQISDVGDYVCWADGKTATATLLEVVVPSLIPTVTNPSPVKVGDAAKFICKTENENISKPVTYKWTKNGSNVSPGTPERGALLFSPVTKENAGKYVCVAGRKASTEQELVVYFPHNVQVKLNKTTVNEHEFVRFECATSGGNPDVITRYQWLWEKSGSTTEQVVQDTDRGTDTSTQYGQFLEFARIPYDKSGTYSCKAWNQGGMGQGSTDLNVRYSPRIDPEAKLKYDVAGEMGKEASFELFIIANPTPNATDYLWSKNGSILSNSPLDYYDIISGMISSKLIIKNVTASDYTNFACSVKTSGFPAKDFTFKLRKAGPPSAPIMLRVVNSTAVAATLKWISEFNGGSRQKFYVECKKSTENWDVASEVPQGGITDPGLKKVVYHKVMSLESNASYVFRVRSKNSHPGAHTSNFSKVASVRTKVKPKTSLISVSRRDNKVIVRWKQVTGKFTEIKIRYCQTSEDCADFIVTNPDDNIAAFFVDAGKTYYYYMVVEDGGDVVYRSADIQDEVDDKCNSMFIGFAFFGVLVGAVIAAITVVVVAIVLWKREMVPWRKRKSHQPVNDTEVHNDTRVELPIIGNYSVQSYANIMPEYVNVLSNERTDEQNSLQPGESHRNDPAADSGAYEIVDSPMTTTWQQDISGQKPVPHDQESQYTHLGPIAKIKHGEYLDFRQLSAK